MSDDEQEKPCENCGCFKSEDRLEQFPALVDYPGCFTLPDPFLDRHMREWWAAAFLQRKGIDVLDYDYAECEWKAVVALIRLRRM